jgi:ABC-type transport system involved in multi-copper enzyme maturation permease subunit
MVNLLKHEFFKFFRSLGFKLLMIIVPGVSLLFVGLSILMLSGFEMPEGYSYSLQGYSAILSAFGDFSNVSIIIAVIVSMIVVTEFQSSTIKNTVMYNQSRLNIYVAKYILQLASITIAVTAYLLSYVILFNLYSGWGETFSFSSLWDNYIRIYLMGLMLCYAISAFINFFAYLTKNTALLIVIIIAITFIFSILYMYQNDLPPLLESFSKILFSLVVVRYYSDSSIINFVYYLISVSLLFFPFFLGGYMLFNRQEIK